MGDQTDVAAPKRVIPDLGIEQHGAAKGLPIGSLDWLFKRLEDYPMSETSSVELLREMYEEA